MHAAGHSVVWALLILPLQTLCVFMRQLQKQIHIIQRCDSCRKDALQRPAITYPSLVCDVGSQRCRNKANIIITQTPRPASE